MWFDFTDWKIECFSIGLCVRGFQVYKLQNNYHGNVRMATMLIHCLQQLSKAGFAFLIASVFFSFLFTSLIITWVTAWARGSCVFWGHCQQDAGSERELFKWWLYDWLIIFGGKFCDLQVNHENNENWHPTKIIRYTVHMDPLHEITWFGLAPALVPNCGTLSHDAMTR